ncbi:hypothetical protein SEEH4316_24290 [Salmonella enterica subsp. enterica serovar Heidelberg str. RI-11-014316]|nr:hypothetical protein SEEH4316_24290 [Salmonella enterica subsp. enterica serovar Heidelberg str. RI-11-014316]
MTHRELQGKMVIKEEIVADLGLRARVGCFFASDPGMAYAGAGLAAGVEFIAPYRNVQEV